MTDSEVRVETTLLRGVESPYAVREVALEIGYGQLAGHDHVAEALRDATERRTFSSDALARLRRLVDGVTRERDELDRLIASRLKAGWSLDRIALIDRAILRIAVYELWHEPELSPRVSVSEAVRLAQIFGAPEHVKFVNGVLGKLVPLSPKAQWQAPSEVGVEVADAPPLAGPALPGVAVAPPLAGDWQMEESGELPELDDEGFEPISLVDLVPAPTDANDPS